MTELELQLCLEEQGNGAFLSARASKAAFLESPIISARSMNESSAKSSVDHLVARN
jgi:hypothetical protein